ncbi:hypothetical protein FRC07_004353 [Ceratobasidium sp. 392]|nr:hypothetical protein FRC07_004353 [Ceratobasidium sp. 392]
MSTSSVLAGLFTSLTDERELFCNDYTSERFQSQIGQRGKKTENGNTFAIKKFEADKFGKQIYIFLTNNTARNQEFKPKAERPENREAFDEALHNHHVEYPNWVSNVSTRHSPTIEFFRRLSKGEQKKYKKVARERIHALHNLSGEDRMLIKANVQVLYVDDAGNCYITTIVTESMGDLEDAPEVDRFVQRVKDWVKDTASKNADTESGPTGGYERFPWDLVGGYLDSWIPSNRRLTGAILGDPTSLRLASLAAWIVYFQDSQSGETPLEHRLQFSKVLAGLSLIDPNISQESSRRLEHVPQHNKESRVLEFSGTITRCHVPGDVGYPEPSIAYAQLLKRNELMALAAAQRAAALTKPDCFLDLPTGDQSPSALIVGQEKVLIFKWAESLKEDHHTLVIELVDSINEHQAHSPASASTATLALTSTERRSYVTPDFSQEPVPVPSQSFADQPPSPPIQPSTLSTAVADAALSPSSAPPPKPRLRRLDVAKERSGRRVLQPNPPPFRPSGSSARTNTKGNNDKEVLPGAHSYWLQNKCSHLFDLDHYSSGSGNAFGPFPPLPPAPQPPLTMTYATLCTGIEASVAKVDAALRGWMTLNESNRTVFDRDARAAQNTACDVSLPLQALVEFATARKLAWERARLIAPSVIGFAAHLVPLDAPQSGRTPPWGIS